MLVGLLVAAIVVVPNPPAVEAQEDGPETWEFYSRWGVASLAADRETANRIYIYAIERVGDTMYVGGAFEQVVQRGKRSRPVDQSFLAAFDANTGDYIKEFTPTLNHPVYSIAVHPVTGSLLVGGEFTEVNGTTRGGLVALDPVTGTIDASFTARVYTTAGGRATVRGIDSDGTHIYIGGGFTRVNDGARTLVRHNLAKFTLDGTLVDWKPHVGGGGVWDVALSTDQQRLFVGGRFNSVDGTSRPGLAMLDAGDASQYDAFRGWSDVARYCYVGYPGCVFVYDLEVDGGHLLVTGAEHFSSLHDDTTGERLYVWPDPHDTQAGYLDGDYVWITRHGRERDSGLWYARSRATGEYLVVSAGQGPSRGAGGFAFEKGPSGCMWFGGTLAAVDLAEVAGTSRIGIDHMGFLCPPGTTVPPSTVSIDDVLAPPPPPVVVGTCSVSLALGQITVDWELPADVTSTVVYRTPAGGDRAFWQGKVDAPGTSFTQLMGWADSYAYQVAYRTAAGLAAPVDCGVVTNTPPEPGDAACTAVLDAGQVTVSWTVPAGVDSTVIYRRPAGGASFFWQGRVDAPAATFSQPMGWASSFDYEIKFKTGNSLSTAAPCGTVGA